MFVGIVFPRPSDDGDQSEKIWGRYALPVPLKENCTVHPVVDVAIAVRLR